MLTSNSWLKVCRKSCSQSWRRKRKLQWKGFAEKGYFKSGMKERVGDGKLIIISMTVSEINERTRFYS